MSSNSHPAGSHFLQIPGPSNIPDSVLRAMSQAIVDHRGPGFPSLTHEILDQLRPIFNTQSHIIIYPSSGTGAWEAALAQSCYNLPERQPISSHLDQLLAGPLWRTLQG